MLGDARQITESLQSHIIFDTEPLCPFVMPDSFHLAILSGLLMAFFFPFANYAILFELFTEYPNGYRIYPFGIPGP